MLLESAIASEEQIALPAVTMSLRPLVQFESDRIAKATTAGTGRHYCYEVEAYGAGNGKRNGALFEDVIQGMFF